MNFYIKWDFTSDSILNQFVKCHKQLAKTADDSSKSKAISVNTDSCFFIISFAWLELRAKFLKVKADNNRILLDTGPSSIDFKLYTKLVDKSKIIQNA